MGQSFAPEKKGRIEQYYTIKERLGQGSFGIVRLCIRNSDKLKAAVKIIKKRDLQEKEMTNLEREAKILQLVDHNHCVRLYDIFDTKHHLYLVMELCEGGELFDAICEGNFNEESAADIIRQITVALQYLHKNGVVHRDLKPENLLYATKKKKQIKLMDFGLAKTLDSQDEALETRCGTLHYVAPEVLEKKKYNKNCDFWSLGVILYVLLCGYLPFYHEERSMTVRLIRAGKFTFDDEEWGDISDNAKDLIRNLLQKDPTKRWTAVQILQSKFLSKSVASTRTINNESFKENFQKLQTARHQEHAERLAAMAMVSIHLKRWYKQARQNVGNKEKVKEEKDDSQEEIQ